MLCVALCCMFVVFVLYCVVCIALHCVSVVFYVYFVCIAMCDVECCFINFYFL